MTLLPIHIIAGLLALVGGAVALYAVKGSTLHRKSGLVFVAAMLVMTSSALVMAVFFRPNRVNVVAAVITFYLVTTALLTVRRSVEQSRSLLMVLMLAALSAGVFALSLGIEGTRGHGVDGVPAAPMFMFCAIGLIGAVGDARVLVARSIQGAQRIARHLWRMTLAMWIATTSFFLGQAKFFPEPLRKSGLLVIPVLLVLGLMIYWLVRTLRRRRSTA